MKGLPRDLEMVKIDDGERSRDLPSNVAEDADQEKKDVKSGGRKPGADNDHEDTNSLVTLSIDEFQKSLRAPASCRDRFPYNDKLINRSHTLVPPRSGHD